MRRGIFGTLLGTLLVGLLAACGGGPEPGPLSVVAPMDAAQGQLPEGIAATGEAFYVGMAPTSQVMRVTKDGVASPYAQLPQVPPNQGFMTGMALDAEGDLYVALASFVPEVTSGIYRVPNGGGVASLFASGMVLPNGLAFDGSGNLFASDSMASAVLKVSPDGQTSTWLEHEMLAGNREVCGTEPPGFDVGPNGIAFDGNGDLFVLVTHGGKIVRVPVKDDGSADTPEVFVGPDCQNLEGADGLAIDSKGNLYVVSFLIHKLVRVDQDKEITVLDSGGLLDSPASLAFGLGDDGKNLYITNFAFLSATGGGQPKPGVLKKEIGIKGRELP